MASLKHNGTELARFTARRSDEGFDIVDTISYGTRGWALRKRTVYWSGGEVTKGTWKRWLNGAVIEALRAGSGHTYKDDQTVLRDYYTSRNWEVEG